MTGSAEVLLLLFVASSIHLSTSAALTPNDTEDILGEHVNEMSYSDIKDVLGNNSKSDTDGFDVVEEWLINEELAEEVQTTLNTTHMTIFVAIYASGPVLFIITALLYCLALDCEKRQKKRKRSFGGEKNGLML